MIIYVGNISLDTTNDDLKKAFEKFGKVVYANVICANDTGKSLGFGFVGMVEDDAAGYAIQALNDSKLNGAKIKVRVAYLRMGQRRSGKDRRAESEPNVKDNRRTGKERRSGSERRKRKSAL
jgi:RNA recognition motif-containing protein